MNFFGIQYACRNGTDRQRLCSFEEPGRGGGTPGSPPEVALVLNKMRPDLNYDASLPLRSVAEDLAAIDAGVEQLDALGDLGASQ
jgi:hypothetical protein